MNVAPIMLMTSRPNQLKATEHQTSITRFKDMLSSQQKPLESPKVDDIKVESFETQSLEDIKVDIEEILNELSVESGIFEGSFQNDPVMMDLLNGLPAILKTEVLDLIEGAFSLDEILNSLDDGSTIIETTALLLGMEKLLQQTKADFSKVMPKLNELLQHEFSSFANSQVDPKSILQSISAMNDTDIAKLETTILKEKALQTSKQEYPLLAMQSLNQLNESPNEMKVESIETQSLKDIKVEIEKILNELSVESGIFEGSIQNEPVMKDLLNGLLQQEFPSFTNSQMNPKSILPRLGMMNEVDLAKLEATIFVEKVLHTSKQEFPILMQSLEQLKESPNVVSQLIRQKTDTPLLNKVIESFSKELKERFGNDSVDHEFTSNSKVIDITILQKMLSNVISGLNESDLPKQSQKEENHSTIVLNEFVSKESFLTVTKEKIDPALRQEFTNQVLEAMKKSKFAQLANNTNRLTIKLNPEHLGALTIRLIQQNGEMVAKIIASTQSSKELLEHSLHQLRQALPSLNVQIDRFEVFSEPFNSLKDQAPKEEKREKQFNESEQERDDDSEQSFTDTLKVALNTTV
ncbi:flagellar hook-length control protein FliK [Metabacillus herbersteinensis]|uniref:Flagellar hook-length control protein FliK n=1 Tax=Metabacillus herbersteinensis TaxID=283816 RepID=A0ABV6GC97_9BACI